MLESGGLMLHRSRVGEWERGRGGEGLHCETAHVECSHAERGNKVFVGLSPRLPVSPSPYLRCLLIGAALALAGCPQKGPPPTPPASRASVALRVLVVNEPGVVEAINRLRGEWAERSGGELSAVAAEWKQVAGEMSLDADVVIFPSRYLGDLCTRGWLRPMRPNVLESKDFDEADVFPLVRRVLVRWGKQVMALPLSIDVALPGITPGKAISDHPAIEFLADAASTVISSERDGVLFDPPIDEAADCGSGVCRGVETMVHVATGDQRGDHRTRDADSGVWIQRSADCGYFVDAKCCQRISNSSNGWHRPTSGAACARRQPIDAGPAVVSGIIRVVRSRIERGQACGAGQSFDERAYRRQAVDDSPDSRRR